MSYKHASQSYKRGVSLMRFREHPVEVMKILEREISVNLPPIFKSFYTLLEVENMIVGESGLLKNGENIISGIAFLNADYTYEINHDFVGFNGYIDPSNLSRELDIDDYFLPNQYYPIAESFGNMAICVGYGHDNMEKIALGPKAGKFTVLCKNILEFQDRLGLVLHQYSSNPFVFENIYRRIDSGELFELDK